MIEKQKKWRRRCGWSVLACMGVGVVILSTAWGSNDATARLADVRAKIRDRYSDVPMLSTAELADWLADHSRVPPLLLDVRTEAEFSISHLKDARRVEPGKPTKKLLESLDPDRAVVVYCSVGERSSKFARELRKQGIKKVFNLDGSIFQWANEGRPLYAGNGPATWVHPYNRRWGRYLKKELHPPAAKDE